MVCFRSTPAVINTRLKPYIFINKSKIDSVFIFLYKNLYYRLPTVYSPYTVVFPKTSFIFQDAC